MAPVGAVESRETAGPVHESGRVAGPSARGGADAARTRLTRFWEDVLSDLLARAVIVVLFLGLAYRIGLDYLETGRPTGLLLLASELIVVVLTIARRRARSVDRRWRARAFAALSLPGPLLVRPSSDPAALLEVYTVGVSAIGLLIIIGGKLSLGRSFGLMPANRGIVCSGLYRFVRHPIYLGYLITHVAFLAAHPTRWNAVVLLVSDVALLVRAAYEERTLVQDPQYAAYRQRVRWRLVPHLF
jgi:protein-S-isoprenylcysteine O-methyltransferase Ste14